MTYFIRGYSLIPELNSLKYIKLKKINIVQIVYFNSFNKIEAKKKIDTLDYVNKGYFKIFSMLS